MRTCLPIATAAFFAAGLAVVAMACSSDPAAPAPSAPKLETIAAMVGGLHVQWTNVDTSCDSVEGERQAKTADGALKEAYKLVFSVPGVADNKHDATATEDLEYSYRLRCKKGSTYSAYSNELSANPKQ